jgi:hypothetical protein
MEPLIPSQPARDFAASAWLAYAREVVGDQQHIAECARLGGSPKHPGVDAVDLRWPGYLGSGFSGGSGVLIVSNIHRHFASGPVGRSDRDRLVQVTRQWRDRRVDDDTYLNISEEVYLAGMRRWAVGRQLRYLTAALGISLNQVAFVNAARCQYPEIPPALAKPKETKIALQLLCLRRFPVSDLVSGLKPSVVLFTSTVAFDQAAQLSHGPQLSVCIHQLSGQLTRPLDLGSSTVPKGTSRDRWLPEVAKRLSQDLSNSAS